MGENKTKSSLALFIFIIFTWNFELWMIPFSLLLLLGRKIIHLTMTGGWKNLEDLDVVEAFDDIEEESQDKTGTLDQLQIVGLKVQENFGQLTSFLESVKNIFNFSIPFLSWLAFASLLFITFLLYVLPLRVIVIMWGVNKITKKLFRPWSSSNNELADFLSRVPDDKEKAMYKEKFGEIGRQVNNSIENKII